MNCRRCQRLLSAFIDGELAEKRAKRISDHLAACAACTNLRDELLRMLHGLAGIASDEPPLRSRANTRPFALTAALTAAALMPEVDPREDEMWARIESCLVEDERRVQSKPASRALASAREFLRRHPQLAPATAALVLGGALAGGTVMRQVQTKQAATSADRELLRETQTALAKSDVLDARVIEELRAIAEGADQNADNAAEKHGDKNDRELSRLERAVARSRELARDGQRPRLAAEEQLQADYRAEIVFLEEALDPEQASTGESALGNALGNGNYRGGNR